MAHAVRTQMEDEHSLRKWLTQTDLKEYVKDKEVQVLLTSLKERITSLKEVRLLSPLFATTCVYAVYIFVVLMPALLPLYLIADLLLADSVCV